MELTLLVHVVFVILLVVVVDYGLDIEEAVPGTPGLAPLFPTACDVSSLCGQIELTIVLIVLVLIILVVITRLLVVVVLLILLLVGITTGARSRGLVLPVSGCTGTTGPCALYSHLPPLQRTHASASCTTGS
jgi:hypothetical protein